MRSGIFKAALSLAQLSLCYPFKVSAIIFSGKRILSTGINEVRSSSRIHPKYKRFLSGLHAETSALMHMFPDNPKGASIFVCKINPSGRISNAKPCCRCQFALADAGVKYVYCTNDEGEVDKYKIYATLKKVKFSEKIGHDYSNMFVKRHYSITENKEVT